MFERLAVQVLHDQEVTAISMTHVIQHANIGMRELREDSGLRGRTVRLTPKARPAARQTPTSRVLSFPCLTRRKLTLTSEPLAPRRGVTFDPALRETLPNRTK